MTSIDLTQKFPHLSKAPIVEAAVEIRVVPSVMWNEESMQSELERCLPDFSKVKPIRHAIYQLPTGKQTNPVVEDFGCVGFKLHSGDNLHIAQFKKDAFVFSRLKPYVDWQQLSKEALRLWKIYCELLKPKQVTRIGLRFINRITIKHDKVAADYYKYPPKPLEELDWVLAGYLHHDVMQIPETLYKVNLIKTIQDVSGDIGLILDIDVFAVFEKGDEYDELRQERFLEEMRWVKNKIFFSSLTEKAIQEFK